jgi:hypothetical protein
MLARFVVGTVFAAAVAAPALAGQMNADEARRFVSGKVFAFTCFDGTRGAGRILDDGGATGSVQFAGAGPMRHLRLPGNTLQVRGQAVCASLKGLPFEPCFNLVKDTERSFRGSVSGMGFAYCDFRHQGGPPMRRIPRYRRASRPRGSRAPGSSRSNPSRRSRKPHPSCAARRTDSLHTRRRHPEVLTVLHGEPRRMGSKHRCVTILRDAAQERGCSG